jgi:hypothetical protein
MNKMNGKIEILIAIIFSLGFLILLTSSVKADCYYPCRDDGGCDCGVAFYQGNVLNLDHSSCIIGSDYWCGGGSGYSSVHSCTNDANTRKCQGNSCPDYGGWNKAYCKVRKDCWSGVSCYSTDCEGVWDASKRWCVECEGKTKTYRLGSTEGIDVTCGNCHAQSVGYICESACGAPDACDDIRVYTTLPDICGEDLLVVNRYCSGAPDCNYGHTDYYCNSDNCGVSRSCGGNTYYCVYDNGKWKWSISKPTGFCCKDADCSACANHVNPTCDSPPRNTENPTYRCKCELSCYSSNSNCEIGYCCEGVIGKDCNSDGDTNDCIPKGICSAYPQYLCDPPGWIESETSIKTKQGLLENILALIMGWLGFK